MPICSTSSLFPTFFEYVFKTLKNMFGQNCKFWIFFILFLVKPKPQQQGWDQRSCRLGPTDVGGWPARGFRKKTRGFLGFVELFSWWKKLLVKKPLIIRPCFWQGVRQGRVGLLAIKLTWTLKMNGLEEERPFNHGKFGVHVTFPGRTKNFSSAHPRVARVPTIITSEEGRPKIYEMWKTKWNQHKLK